MDPEVLPSRCPNGGLSGLEAKVDHKEDTNAGARQRDFRREACGRLRRKLLSMMVNGHH